MLPKAVVTNGHTEHSTTAANEPNVPPEKWQQKRLVRQKEKLRSNLLKSGFQFLDRFVELLKEMEDVHKDTKKKYLQKRDRSETIHYPPGANELSAEL
ncbi:unnamed protein product [Lepidochelys olivacea]